jgi:hypothetical protein
VVPGQASNVSHRSVAGPTKEVLEEIVAPRIFILGAKRNSLPRSEPQRQAVQLIQQLRSRNHALMFACVFLPAISAKDEPRQRNSVLLRSVGTPPDPLINADLISGILEIDGRTGKSI